MWFKFWLWYNKNVNRCKNIIGVNSYGLKIFSSSAFMIGRKKEKKKTKQNVDQTVYWIAAVPNQYWATPGALVENGHIIFPLLFPSSRSPRLSLPPAGPRTLALRFHAARVEFIPNSSSGQPRFLPLRSPLPKIQRRAPGWIRWTSWASPRRTSPSPNVSSPALDHLVDVGFCLFFATYDDHEAV
jgi:hypothetical protein